MTGLIQEVWSTKRALLIVVVGVYAVYVTLLFFYARRMKGVDPALASLSEPALSQRYDSAFWDRKRRTESNLWREALTFCAKDDTRNRPNCLIVEAVEKASSAVTHSIRTVSNERACFRGGSD